jgi:hypothetical protein
VLVHAGFTGFDFEQYEVALRREDDDVDFTDALGLVMQTGPLDAVVGVEAIGKALLELLYIALVVSASGDEFDLD